MKQAVHCMHAWNKKFSILKLPLERCFLSSLNKTLITFSAICLFMHSFKAIFNSLIFFRELPLFKRVCPLLLIYLSMLSFLFFFLHSIMSFMNICSNFLLYLVTRSISKTFSIKINKARGSVSYRPSTSLLHKKWISY